MRVDVGRAIFRVAIGDLGYYLVDAKDKLRMSSVGVRIESRLSASRHQSGAVESDRLDQGDFSERKMMASRSMRLAVEIKPAHRKSFSVIFART